jgi:phosphoglycolate phosphatase-like HAD superfamily hydrolase
MQFYHFDEAKAWDAVNFYRERFKVTGLYENRVFDGVPALLEALNGQAARCISPPPNRGSSPAKSPGI